MRLASDFWVSKTTWASLATILTTIGGAIQGQISPFHAALMVLGVLHLPFLRDAWVKSAEDLMDTLYGVAAPPASSSDAAQS